MADRGKQRLRNKYMAEQENLKQKTKKGLYWKFFDQFANYGMQFVVGIVMARLLSPSDYGITALPAVFMAVAGVFIEGSFGAALIRKQDLTQKDLSTAFYYSIAMGGAMYVILFFTAPFIADFYNTPILTSLIRVTALTFLWGPLGTPQSVILNRRLDFKTPTRISIINKIAGAIVGIIAAYNGYGLWALVLSGMISSLLGLIQTWFAVRWLPTERFSKESFRYLWNYGNKLIATRLIDTLYSNIAPIILGKFGGTTDLGNYNRAKGYAMMPSSNIVGVLNGVTFPVLSKMQNDTEALRRNYRKMIRVSAYLLFPIMLMLSALARPLVITMITEKWEACIILLQLLCFVFMWQPIHILNMNLLQVMGRTDLTLKLEMIKKPIAALLIICALPFGVIPFILSELFMQYFCLIINTYYSGKLINVGLFVQLRDILPSFVLSFVMFGVILGINQYIPNHLLQVVVGVVVGAAVYLLGTYLLKLEEINEVKYLLSRKE